MGAYDGNFLGDGLRRSPERAERRTLLQERLEGRMLSRLHYLDTLGPTGSRGLGLELDTGAKLCIFAARDRNSRYTARLVFRWIDRPRIVLPRMDRTWRRGRDADPTAGPADDLQRYVEGQQIRGILSTRTPTASGGEQCALEMADRGRLAIAAQVAEARTDRGELLRADIVYEYSRPERTMIVMP